MRAEHLYCVCMLLLAGDALAEDRRETTVGMTARIDQLVLPGPVLEAKPHDDRAAPLVVRILATYPHGTAFRYDVAYYGLDPGTFDLKDYLRRKDGSSATDLPSLPVTIKPVLPPGQIKPNALTPESTPFLGGYRLALIAGGVLWVGGLAAILFVGRRRQKTGSEEAARPLTLADKLRPLIERGIAGQLGVEECADLERSLLAYWRRRLALEDHKPAEAFALLRRHPEAGPLLEQLERWLHRPGSSEKVDVAALLRPYRDLPAETLKVETPARAT